MFNAHRGEIVAALDGQTYRLCLTLGALAELESAFGHEDMIALANRFSTGRIAARDAARIIGAGLRGAGHDITDAAVLKMRTDGGVTGYVDIVARLLAATFGADAGGHPKRDQERADAGGHPKRDQERADAGGHPKRDQERADAGGHPKRNEESAEPGAGTDIRQQFAVPGGEGVVARGREPLSPASGAPSDFNPMPSTSGAAPRAADTPFAIASFDHTPTPPMGRAELDDAQNTLAPPFTGRGQGEGPPNVPASPSVPTIQPSPPAPNAHLRPFARQPDPFHGPR